MSPVEGRSRGRKFSQNEGGHRVPDVAWWPGSIKAGTRSDACNDDIESDPDRRYAATQFDAFESEHWRTYLKWVAEPSDLLRLESAVYFNSFERSWNKLDQVNGTSLHEGLVQYDMAKPLGKSFGLPVYASATWTHAEFKNTTAALAGGGNGVYAGGADGNEIPYVPEWKLSANYRINENFKLLAGVHNLFDERGIVSRIPEGPRANSPRTYYVGIEAKF